MELNEQNGLLEELLALRRDMSWEASINHINNPTQEMSEIFSISNNDYFGFDYINSLFDQIQNPCSNLVVDQNNNNHNALPISPPIMFDQSSFYSHSLTNHEQQQAFPCNDNNFMSSSDFSSLNNNVPPQHTHESHAFQAQQEPNQHMSLLYPLLCSTTSMEEEELDILGDEIHNLETQISCKIEPITTTTPTTTTTTTTTTQSSNISSPELNNIPSLFNIGHYTPLERKNSNNNTCVKSKKLQGQPSKNLMAERRRRKRLNDRLSMLRSIVPKISKMDRTSILGDTIDYMKELLEKIDNLRGEIEANSGESTAEIGLFKDVKPNEVLVRNSPKFDVEKRKVDTKVEICCAGKPGLLYSTVTTLEALGLEIQQCVISCFNDFAMQASCTEDLEKRTMVGCEEVKQALFRNAGYGGRCL